jgi:hypothetical protein
MLSETYCISVELMAHVNCFESVLDVSVRLHAHRLRVQICSAYTFFVGTFNYCWRVDGGN